MKWILFLTAYSAFVVTGLVIDLSIEKGRYDSAQIAVLQKHNLSLTAAVEYREEIEYKKIELDYLWPIALEDWVPGFCAITSYFGERDDSEAGGLSDGYHEGSDMWGLQIYEGIVEMGRIAAVADGWVEHFLNDPVKGEWYLLHHDDGNESEYHHVSKGYVLDGDRVAKGQVIARMGNTGISTGPHLHFQLTIDGKLINPLKYIEIPKE